MTEFFMAMIPPTITAQEHKITVKGGKPIVYDPPELTAAKENILAHLYQFRLVAPYENVALRLTTKWCFPNGSHHRDGEYRITKPDTDNLQKMLKDCMTKAGFWKDDALVASEITEKFWAKIPGIYIKIEVVGGTK